MTSPFASLLNDSQYHYFFLITDPFLGYQSATTFSNISLVYAHDCPDYQKALHRGTSVFCFSPNSTRAIANSGDLLSQPSVQKFIVQTASTFNKIPAIVPFKPSAKIEKICQKNNWLVVANPAATNRIIEDKIKFYNLAQTYHLPVVPSLIFPLNEANFSQAVAQFALPLIVQTHFGWAGKSTYRADSFTALQNIAPETPVKMSPYLPGYTLTNNACLTANGVIISPPALQLTGLPSLTTHPFTTVGRQWPANCPPTISLQIKNITLATVPLLRQFNFKGFFGLDFLVTNNQVLLLECNPRLTASFDFYTELELQNNLTPLFYLHLAEFSQLNYQLDVRQHQLQINHTKFIGTEITPKDSHNNTISKLHLSSVVATSPTNIVLPLHLVDGQKTHL